MVDEQLCLGLGLGKNAHQIAQIGVFIDFPAVDVQRALEGKLLVSIVFNNQIEQRAVALLLNVSGQIASVIAGGMILNFFG